MGLTDRLCRLTGGTPSALGCASGDGAIVLAINKNTGQVVWRAKAETHPSSKVTGSISGHGDRIFVPVGNWEEDWARAYPNIFVEPIDPASHYPCCSARGSLVAMDVNTGKILWKRFTNIGNDPDHELAPELRALLGPKGSFGTSTYGHNPTVDVRRRQVYIAMAQTTTAPQVAQDCEQARRRTGDPNANIPGLPAGVTCNNLNEKLHIYANAMIAVDMDTGRVNWAFYAHKYDAWNHACGAPDLYGWSTVVPALFPVPLANGIANCTQTPIGPDMGFGQQPKLVKNVKLASGKRGDVVVGGNKDGRLFGLDPATGEKDLGDQRRPGRRLRRLAVRACYRRWQGVLRHDQFAEQWQEHQDALRPGHALPRYQRLHGARPEDRALREARCGRAVRVPVSVEYRFAVPGPEHHLRDQRVPQCLSRSRRHRRPARAS
jgi:polyvinyl alcohol dehydrogenase (cytochrome)